MLIFFFFMGLHLHVLLTNSAYFRFTRMLCFFSTDFTVFPSMFKSMISLEVIVLWCVFSQEDIQLTQHISHFLTKNIKNVDACLFIR